MNRQVLIVGAGIAGTATAYWLARHGFEPTVVEGARQLRVGGNGVDVRGQAVEVVEKMGIASRLSRHATDIVGMSFVDATGRRVGSIETSPRDDGRARTEVEIMRGDLTRILHELGGSGVEYRFGVAPISLDQDADGVSVAFSNGGHGRYDLVVGADGLHSSVRRLAFGPESEFVRFRDHYFAFSNADESLGEAGWMTIFNVPGKMAGVYRSGTHAGAKAYFMFRSPEPLSYDHRDVSQQRAMLGETFDGMGWKTQDLLDGAYRDPEIYFDALSQVRMTSWSSGRIVLVGDAAYCASPVTGAGAMLALVGAYRLAGELARTGGEHRAAFASYAREFRASVERSQSQVFTGLLVPRTRSALLVRNAIARLPVLGSLAGRPPRRVAALPRFA